MGFAPTFRLNIEFRCVAVWIAFNTPPRGLVDGVYYALPDLVSYSGSAEHYSLRWWYSIRPDVRFLFIRYTGHMTLLLLAALPVTTVRPSGIIPSWVVTVLYSGRCYCRQMPLRYSPATLPVSIPFATTARCCWRQTNAHTDGGRAKGRPGDVGVLGGVVGSADHTHTTPATRPPTAC